MLQMNWILCVMVLALFSLARRTATRKIPAGQGDLLNWYRSWDRDSSDQAATVAELSRMLEAYRQRCRRASRLSSLAQTELQTVELKVRGPAAALTH
jgi:hypothetical protein